MSHDTNSSTPPCPSITAAHRGIVVGQQELVKGGLVGVRTWRRKTLLHGVSDCGLAYKTLRRRLQSRRPCRPQPISGLFLSMPHPFAQSDPEKSRYGVNLAAHVLYCYARQVRSRSKIFPSSTWSHRRCGDLLGIRCRTLDTCGPGPDLRKGGAKWGHDIQTITERGRTTLRR